MHKQDNLRGRPKPRRFVRSTHRSLLPLQVYSHWPSHPWQPKNHALSEWDPTLQFHRPPASILPDYQYDQHHSHPHITIHHRSNQNPWRLHIAIHHPVYSIPHHDKTINHHSTLILSSTGQPRYCPEHLASPASAF